MPFFGLLKQELYGKDLIEKLGKEDIDILVDLTRDSIEIIRKETQSVDFWDNYPQAEKTEVLHNLTYFTPELKEEETSIQ